jgi:hypothetical protein
MADLERAGEILVPCLVAIRAIAGVLMLASLTVAATPLGNQTGFEVTERFSGKDLSGWVNVNTDADTWSVRDGRLICSGRPTGVMRSARQYENFVLHIEWMHMEAGGNSGVFVWSDAEPDPRTRLPNGVEVQMLELEWPNLHKVNGVFARARAQGRIWRELERAARSSALAAAIQAEADRFITQLVEASHAPGLPRRTVALHRLVVVPRALAAARARHYARQCLDRLEPFESVDPRVRAFFFDQLVGAADADSLGHASPAPASVTSGGLLHCHRSHHPGMNRAVIREGDRNARCRPLVSTHVNASELWETAQLS